VLSLSDADTIVPSAAELAALTSDGFLVLDNILDETTTSTLAQRLDRILSVEGADAGREFRHLVDPADRTGADYLGHLYRKDPVFEACFTAPRLLGIVRALLGDEVRLHATATKALRTRGSRARLAERGPLGT
jgi:hypothetical protein